ncbi:hypothetical protein EM65_017110 [Vibrio parahaemolyticus]|nr:hypothetical protein EM65_017110 [Vibrio parahaemolyticus]
MVFLVALGVSFLMLTKVIPECDILFFFFRAEGGMRNRKLFGRSGYFFFWGGGWNKLLLEITE